MHHCHPEILFDGFQPQRAVASHAGKNNADGFFLLVRRQVPEEEVDRHPLAPRGNRFEHLELSVQDGQVRIRGNHVDVIGLNLHPIFHLDDLHLGVPRRSSGIMPLCVGSRCGTRTNAKPVSGGKWEKNCSNASNPPADPPIPTT